MILKGNQIEEVLNSLKSLVILAWVIMGVQQSKADSKRELAIYLSADRTGAKASGQSIEQGIRTALYEINNSIDQFPITLKVLDHRGSTPRAKKHLNVFLQDPSALVMFSGLHSPPLLAAREFINKKEILLLDPWAAAGPITRYPSRENWIFRLSVDDSKAGYVIADYAVLQEGIKLPAFLLEQTGWGKSNNRTMTQALANRGLKSKTTKWFNWGLSVNNARILLRELHQIGADSIFLVANAPEGKVIARAMASLPIEQRLPIFSHWGITGGDFAESVGSEIRGKFKLRFIQTSFSFLSNLSDFQKSVFASATKLYPDIITRPTDIKAPTGFIHAYDLTKILIAAINQIELTDNNKINRTNIRVALENLNTPVKGLIKTYKSPYSVFSEGNLDAHEALGVKDLRMAQYGPNNEIIIDTKYK